MLHLLPKHSGLPSLKTMLDDLGAPNAKRVAKALGVSERTVRRWLAAEQAPRAVMLALFWITRWGQSLLNSEAFHAADRARALVGALTSERDELRSRLQRLGAIGEFGSANDPEGDSVPAPLHIARRGLASRRLRPDEIAAALSESDQLRQRTRERHTRELRRAALDLKRGFYDRENAA